jgi:uncharacterized protein (TIGR03083 family)
VQVTEPVVGLLDQQYRSLEELCDELPVEAWSNQTDCPGWTVQDQVAHVIGTESMLAGRQAPAVGGAVTDAPHVKNPIGAANEQWVESFRGRPPAEVVATLHEVLAERRRQLAERTTEQFDELGPSPIGNVPYREFMQVRVMDIWVHEQDVRRAVERPGNRGGATADVAIGRFVPAMAFVVGKKVDAPDGTTVAFELTGDSSRRFAVAVRGGRAQVEEEPAASPTVRLTMEAETWWCLSMGRWDGPTARQKGLVRIEGDRELGERVVDNLSFMI